RVERRRLADRCVCRRSWIPRGATREGRGRRTGAGPRRGRAWGRSAGADRAQAREDAGERGRHRPAHATPTTPHPPTPDAAPSPPARRAGPGPRGGGAGPFPQGAKTLESPVYDAKPTPAPAPHIEVVDAPPVVPTEIGAPGPAPEPAEPPGLIEWPAGDYVMKE